METHLHIVKQVIHSEIIVNESIYGFEYDDLYQEGCIWLCKAAATFQPEKEVQFSAYARKVVTNGLRTYCRLMCNKQKRLVSLPSTSGPEDSTLSLDQFAAEDSWESILSQMDASFLLGRLKSQYQGTIRLGIEALEWKALGYTGTQIAAMYGVKPNLVGAWISRAVSHLKKNTLFLSWAEQFVAKSASQTVNGDIK